jgi:hypothetical protein
MFQTVSSAGFLIVFMFTAVSFPDATVVQSGSPTFPLQVDKVTLFVPPEAGTKRDSLTVRLPASLYAELRDNIDTIFTYADALRRHRRELSGTFGGDEDARPCLTLEYMGLCVMRIFFVNNGFRSGKLIAAVDRYPFVVVMTRGFSARLKKLVRTGQR